MKDKRGGGGASEPEGRQMPAKNEEMDKSSFGA